jgi:hypothetical protein
MSSPFKYALFFICISVSMAPIAFAEKNTLGEEISILDVDVLDQEIKTQQPHQVKHKITKPIKPK